VVLLTRLTRKRSLQSTMMPRRNSHDVRPVGDIELAGDGREVTLHGLLRAGDIEVGRAGSPTYSQSAYRMLRATQTRVRR
jgi:hypothetical protein